MPLGFVNAAQAAINFDKPLVNRISGSARSNVVCDLGDGVGIHAQTLALIGSGQETSLQPNMDKRQKLF